jgi:hypothetical protein
MEAPQQIYVLHRPGYSQKTISYCVKDVSGRIQQEGKIGATRRQLNDWMKTLPQPWTVAMEATIFTGWVDERSRAPTRYGSKGRPPGDAASDRRSEEEERPHRCRQDCRLPTM